MKFIDVIKNTMQKKRHEKGFSILELLIAIGLFTVFVPALLIGFAASREGRPQLEQRMKATALLREAEETVRVAREADWQNIATDGVYHPIISGSTLSLGSNYDTTSTGFKREIDIADVYRLTDGTIVDSTTPGSKLDLSTKKITTTISWSTPRQSLVTSVMYLTRFGNTVWSQTTQSDFQAGSYPATIAITNTSGGEVTLGTASGGGDWCSPNLSITALDLTRQSVPTAISATYKNVYTATGMNSSGDSLDHIGITDTTYPTPPQASEVGSYNNYKSYGLYADPSTSRVYITSDHPGLTVDIVNGSTNTNVSSFADSGGENGVSVYVSGTTGFVTTEKSNGSSTTLYSFDTTKTPAKELGKIALNGSGKKIVVVGQFAYVVTSNTSKQLQVFDVSDPKNMKLSWSLSMGNNAPGVYLSVDAGGTTADLVTSYVSSTTPDVFIVNLSSKTITKSYNTNGMNPRGVALIPGGWMIVVGSGGQQYQVFRTSNASTSPCGSLPNANGSSTIYAVDYVQEPDGDVFSYILTDNSSKEFQIIQGGSGGPGGGYASSGTFTSSVFDASRVVAFNTFSSTASIPAGTTVSYKVAIKSPIGGSCSGVSFMSSDFLTLSPGVLPLQSGSGYANPGQCLQYQLILTTSNPSVAPVVSDISFNYSL